MKTNDFHCQMSASHEWASLYESQTYIFVSVASTFSSINILFTYFIREILHLTENGND